MFGTTNQNVFGTTNSYTSSAPNSQGSIFAGAQSQQLPRQSYSFGPAVIPPMPTANTSTMTKDVYTLPDDVLESCKCEYCNCYVSVGPVRMIDNKIACGRCEREKDGFRLSVVEALAKQFNFPCRYKNFGCNASLKWILIDSHEKVCDYKEIQCTVTGCDWSGAKSSLKFHFDQKHQNEIINSQKGVKINLKEKITYNYLYISKDKAFLIAVSNDEEKINHQVKFFCTSLEACMYTYDVCIYDSEKKLLFLNQKLQSFDDDHGMFNAGMAIDMIQSVFLKNSDVNISFQIKHSGNEGIKLSVQNIECPVCLEPMLNKIYIGQCGHSLCEKCKKSLQNCPCCRSDFGTAVRTNKGCQEMRNYSLEALIKKLNLEL